VVQGSSGDRRAIEELLRVTLDTNVLDQRTLPAIEAAAKDLPVELAAVTVSDREQRFFEHSRAVPPRHVPESAIWNESGWNTSVWGTPHDGEVLRDVLTVMSSSNRTLTTKPPDAMSDGERRLFRDVMIFQAHVRDRRDILVTNDRRGFIGKDGVIRATLEGRYATRIMTPDEFLAHCDQLRAAAGCAL
jgi:hypothetical protein